MVIIPAQFFVAAPNSNIEPKPASHQCQFVGLQIHGRMVTVPKIAIGRINEAPYFLVRMFMGGPNKTTGMYQIERRMLYYGSFSKRMLSGTSTLVHT